MKRIRDEGLDPTSALGIRLKAEAVQLVAAKCEEVRVANGHCSVWKRISHRDGRGRSVYVEGAVEDVSDEREVRDLRSRAARFTWIFAASGVGILVVRRDGTIQDANPQFVRTFGWQRGALRGRPFLELVDP